MNQIFDEESYRTIESLKQFNLNEYEAKTFVVLLHLGDMKATEIADAADIPQSRVYDVLNSLEKKGLATKQQGTPKQYTANHAERSLEHLLYRIEKSHEERLSYLRNKMTELTEILPARSELNQDPEKIRTMEGVYAVACKLIECMQDCRESLSIVGDSPFVRLKSRSSFDNQIGDREIDIRAVGMFDKDEIIEMRRHNALIREHTDTVQAFFVFDDTRLLHIRESGPTIAGMVTEDFSLVKTYRDRFDHLWAEAGPRTENA